MNVNHPKGSPLARATIRSGSARFAASKFAPAKACSAICISTQASACRAIDLGRRTCARTWASRTMFRPGLPVATSLLVVEEITRVHGVDWWPIPPRPAGCTSRVVRRGRRRSVENAHVGTAPREAHDLVELYCASKRQRRPPPRCKQAQVTMPNCYGCGRSGAAEVGTVGGNSRPQHRGRTDRGRHSQPDGHRFVPAATSSGCHGRRPAAIDSRTLAGGPRLGAGRPTSRDQQLVESANLPWLPVDSKGFARRISA